MHHGRQCRFEKGPCRSLFLFGVTMLRTRRVSYQTQAIHKEQDKNELIQKKIVQFQYLPGFS